MTDQENPEWLPLLSGSIALWLREAIDADELPREPVTFPLLSTRHGLVKVRVQLTADDPAVEETGKTVFKPYVPNGPPCPRCQEPMFKVDATVSGAVADIEVQLWGHDCDPEVALTIHKTEEPAPTTRPSAP